MATNQFKAFASGGSANVTSQADWEALPAILDGFQSGKASSAQVNKALRQATFIAAALAQYISDKNSADVLDDGDIAAFTASLSSALGKDYQALNANLTALAGLTGAADRLPYFSAAGVMALANLTLAGRSLISQTNANSMLTYLGAAALASPTFTGDPKAPTPAVGDNDTSIATTAFVNTALASLSGYLRSSNNLSDLPSIVTARSNLGVPAGVDKQMCIAWVNFNGTGTIAIRDSYGVSSITDLGIGQYQVNFSTTRPTNTYAVSCGVDPESDGVAYFTSSNTATRCAYIPEAAKTTSNFLVSTGSNAPAASSTKIDFRAVNVAVFGA